MVIRIRETPLSNSRKSRKGASKTIGKKTIALYFSQTEAPRATPAARERNAVGRKRPLLSGGERVVRSESASPEGGAPSRSKNQARNTQSIKKVSAWAALL